MRDPEFQEMKPIYYKNIALLKEAMDQPSLMTTEEEIMREGKRWGWGIAEHREMEACKIPTYRTYYAHPISKDKFIIREHSEHAVHDVTKPVTRAQAKRVMGVSIPKSCRYKPKKRGKA